MSSTPSCRHFIYDFSIWYCPKDDDVASSISEHLEKEGFQGFVEHLDQVAGTSIILRTVKAIEASRVAILLLSTKSLGDLWHHRVSQWVLYHSIHCNGTKVIPVYVDVKKADVPPLLQHLLGLEYHREEFLGRLVKNLRTSYLAARRARTALSSKAKN